uniref:Uncharacterized protein n=1 Tax=Chromera velia CCMP2878 TaxID=1169474 RepID=A0A0G4FQX8_9ALVE|eukprot:Cvel_3627.t1-p1 / transcript=Cvel_3627.t1 / gene=Cvel_3627 / organism=Chromera_velia_CCMP2878 / gene_product=hypothetical protein / transcript_product=hypothetical protein / location=Cvel_scaffold149:10065-10373(-) / protein_length=103 / sequence_SO=supercontig / SO=protein_coding / is_pseudo=false
MRLKKPSQAGHSDRIKPRYGCNRNAYLDRLRWEGVPRLLSLLTSGGAPLSVSSSARSVLAASASDSEPEQEEAVASPASSPDPGGDAEEEEQPEGDPEHRSGC